MSHPILAFCPYLETSKIISFAEWEVGPLSAFEGRWASTAFKMRAMGFLRKFVDDAGEPLENPALLCRRDGKIDGAPVIDAEFQALTAAIGFAFLDENPRNSPNTCHNSWNVLTSDNAEPFIWPIDVEAGNVTITTGLMLRTRGGGYQIDDEELTIRPPLDLHMTGGSHTADPQCLEAVYVTVLKSALAPGSDPEADRIKTAIDWFLKAWRNTATLHFAERVVFLKTAFEALTETDKSYVSAARLRALFEGVPDTSPGDTELLIWSPTEREIHTRSYTKSGKTITEHITDLQQWFLAFAAARNTIIHEGVTPSLNYKGSNAAYDGHLVFTAEFLLRAVVKVLLTRRGSTDLWRSSTWRRIKSAWEELEAKEAAEWHRKIQCRAFQLFEERGGAHGNDWNDWFRAEAEIGKP